MDKIDNINVQRILWCCDYKRISIDDLSRALGIAKNTIDKLIEGSDSLTYNQLRKLANYFDRGVLFFLEETPLVDNQVLSAAFRTIANQKFNLDSSTKALVERAEKQREIYAALVEDLDDPPPLFVSPEISEEPVRAAAQVRRWLGLSDRNDFKSFRAAIENKGILVFLTNGFQGKWQIPKQNPILGFSLYDPRLPLVVVKKAQQESRQSFTLMHELAHILIHRSSVIDDESDFALYTGNERVANEFAAHVLLPDSFLNQINLQEKPGSAEQFDDWLRIYRNRWGVSTEVMLLRLLSSHRVSQGEYDDYKYWVSSRQDVENAEGVRLYRHREPRNIFGDRYVRSVLEALDQERITINKASKFLDGLKLSDIRKLESYCATH